MIATAVIVVGALFATRAARADFAEGVRQLLGQTNQTPLPNVVQILAPEPGALSRGSGTLIHVDGKFGYVITNWHVVRDAPGDVVVIFPDGFQSLARVLRTDEDWDLALLLIWRGNASPMPLSAAAPKPGETLTIAGYGGEGKFRAARGVFTNFAAPKPEMPFEMFEVSALARQGDSGGPIVNERGELAGVLFGAGDGRTTGTQVHRVRDFVNTTLGELRELSEAVAQSPLNRPIAGRSADELAAAPSDQAWDSAVRVPKQYIPLGALPAQPGLPSPDPPLNQLAAAQSPSASPTAMPPEGAGWAPRESEPLAFAEGGQRQPDSPSPIEGDRPRSGPALASIRGLGEQPVASAETVSVQPRLGRPRNPSGGITWDQVKSFFAAVGVFALLHTVTQHLFVSKGRGKK
jgi:S1-C subfamily serine protease